MLRYVLAAGALLYFCGCDFFSRERVYEIGLPPLPPGYDFIRSWSVEILGDDGGEEHLLLAGKARSFSFPGVRERRYLVLISGNGPSRFVLRPAGLYLDGRSEGGFMGEYSHGPALLILAEAVRSGFDMRRFNCTRFLDECRNAEARSPWFLDRDRILTALLEGDLSVRDIREGDLFPWEGEETGDWAAEDPFLEWDSPPDLPAGSFRFYSPALSLMREIVMDGEGHGVSLEYSVREP